MKIKKAKAVKLLKEDIAFLDKDLAYLDKKRTVKVARGVRVRLRRPYKLTVAPDLSFSHVRERNKPNRPVLNQKHHNPVKQVEVAGICERVVSLSQVIAEKRFYPYQVKFAYRVVESLLLHDGDTLTALMARQSGKCLAEGTPVMLASGETLPVEDIEKGMQLMGDDSTPRNVLSICQGKETMYEVRPRCGYAEPFTVNESHILSVKSRNGKIHNYSIKEYLALSEYQRRDNLRGYKAVLDFESQRTPIDPYWLGLWLGDGKRTDTRITTEDDEIRQYVKRYAAESGLNWVCYHEKAENNADSYAIVSPKEKPLLGRQWRHNPLLRALQNHGLTFQKHIPHVYFANSFEVRRAVLAGIIDSDGHRSDNRGKESVCEITQKSKRLAWDIVKLARSIGIRASCRPKEATIKGRNVGTVYRICLYGALWELPIRVARKKYQKKALREDPTTYSFDLVKKEKANYYGFTLDGNKLFVLGDLTVTHNTEVVGSIVAAIALILPTLAKMLPDDWKLNITDDNGVYRGFKAGISIGIYAPRMDQAQTMFDRVTKALDTDSAKKVLQELKLTLITKNGQKIVLSNKSTILCQSASVQSKVEGKTHHLLIAEEAQEIDDRKIRKSLSPMLAATKGTMVMIGTATNQKCDFYTQIGNNERAYNSNFSVRNHFFFPYTTTQRYNSQYAEYIEKEKVRLGEDSDEFRMSYECVWIFERGMFITQAQLFQKEVALRFGPFSGLYEFGLPKNFTYYSLVAGIDWGRSHDSTVITIMAVDWNNPIDSGQYVNADGTTDYVHYKKHIVCWKEFIGDDYETQYWEIEEWFKHLLTKGLKKIVLDANGCGTPMFDRFQRNFGRRCEVVGFTFQSHDKSDAYKYFFGDICGKRITFPCGSDVFGSKNCRKFLQQMLDLRKEYKQGLMVVSHPKEKDAHDDYCFVSISLIKTKRGETPISEVTTEDSVWTRQGWKRVLFSGQTGTKEVIRVGNLVATPNHPFWCINKEKFVPLEELGSNDIVLSCESFSSNHQNDRLSSFKESDTSDTREQKAKPEANTSSLPAIKTLCIEQFGGLILAPFQKAMSFITKMKTHGTIPKTVPITNCSLPLNMPLSTCGTSNEKPRTDELSKSLRQLLLRRLFGKVKQAIKGWLDKPTMPGLSKPTELASAKNVETSLALAPTATPLLAPVTVQHAVGNAAVVKYFERLSPGEKVPVYNLTVEGAHEFVCDGVLVHNCDSACLANWGCAAPAMGSNMEYSNVNFLFN